MSGWQQGPGGFNPAPGAGMGAQPGSDEPLRHVPFDSSQLGTISTMATLMLIAGGMGILKGLLDFVSQGVGSVRLFSLGSQALLPVGLNMCGSLITAAIAVVLGIWLFIGARAFKKVIETDESDQLQLVHGLRQLRNVFLLKSILIIAMVLLACGGMVLSAAIAGTR